MGLHFDCGNPDSIEGGIGQVISRFGKIDVLFNNAAATSFEVNQADRTAVDTPIAIRDLVMNVNVRGVMLGCKYAIPHMIRNRSEEHTSELQSLMRISYAVFCLKKNTHTQPTNH